MIEVKLLMWGSRACARLRKQPFTYTLFEAGDTTIKSLSDTCVKIAPKLTQMLAARRSGNPQAGIRIAAL
jgi:hypothetical protein